MKRQNIVGPEMPLRTYEYQMRRLPRWMRVFLPLYVLTNGLMSVYSFRTGYYVGAMVVAAGLVLYMVGWLWEMNSRNVTRLEVLPTGIRLHWQGQQLFAPWRDMQRIEKIKQPGYIEWEGITLNKARWERTWWSRVLLIFWMPRFIPLWSGRFLWDRELGDDLRYFAPWLFDEVPIPYMPNYSPQWGATNHAEASRA